MKHWIFGVASILSLSTAAYAENATQVPDVIEFSAMQSVQPQVITDAQCQKAFKGKIVLPNNFGNYYSKSLDITNRKSNHHTINEDLGLFEWTEVVKIKIEGKDDLISPAFATALYIDRNHKFATNKDNVTNGKTGLFNSYYCTGIVHKVV